MDKSLGTGTLIAACFAAQAALAGELPDSKQTTLGLYLDAEETAVFLDQTPDAVMIDIRTPEEINETGMAEGTDALIPLALLDGQERMISNPDFTQGIAALIDNLDIARDDPIVLICRSGNRSAFAANMLAQLGYSQVYTVTDGYEGDRALSGPQIGERVVNGWKNAGLPWQDRPASSCARVLDGGHC